MCLKIYKDIWWNIIYDSDSLNVISVCVCVLVAQLCPTLCNPMDCSLPGSSIHGISQARILQWVAISFSRGSSQPRDQTRVSCIVGRFFTVWATCGHERNCTTWLGSTSKDAAVKPTRRSHMSINKGHLKRPGKAKAKSRDVVQGV